MARPDRRADVRGRAGTARAVPAGRGARRRARLGRRDRAHRPADGRRRCNRGRGRLPGGARRGAVGARARPADATAAATRAVVQVAEALEGGGDRRVMRIGPGGHVRLVLGMVAANHPVRLIRNLTSAGAAALATTAIALMNSSVWLLSDRLGLPRMAAALLLSIAIMVGWLIVHYDLWEPVDDEEEGILPAGRKRAALFNAATVLTLAAGVITLYALLLAVALASAALVIVDSVFASTLGHGVGAGDYLGLAVFATSIGLVGGALGSGFESQDAVRRVAFGVRERHRREKVDAKRA